MKRYAFAGALALAAVVLVAMLATGAIPIIDVAHGMALATAVVPAAVTGEDVDALTKRLGEISEQVKTVGAEFKTKTEAGEKVSTDLKEKTDKLLTEQGLLRDQIEKLKAFPEQIAALDARAKEMEQTIARRKTGGDDKPDDEKTPGEIFINDPRVKAALAEGAGKFRGRVRVDIKAVTTAGMAGLVVADRVAGLLAIPERRLTVRDLLTPGRTNSNAIQYWQETGFTNNARIQTESQTKGESTIEGELVTANVATIAHFMIAAKQIMDDVPALQSHIDGRLRYGLAYVEETQLLTGDGSNGNLYGLVPQATAYSAPFTPDAMQNIDAIRLALLQAELALFPATGVVTHPTDWARVELTKDGENRYIFVQPQNETQPRLWGRPIVATPAMTASKFLAGAFKLGAQIFDREDANVEISTEDNDNFRKNLITIRGEERLALAVYRPEAFIYGTFPNAT